MASESNAKRKPARGKKDCSEFSITGWMIDHASTSHHVSVCFAVLQESDDGASRLPPRRFLLRYEQAAELINELKEKLEHSAAIQCLEEHAASASLTLTAQSGLLTSIRNGVDDTELPSSNFDLGTYGLIGN